MLRLVQQAQYCLVFLVCPQHLADLQVQHLPQVRIHLDFPCFQLLQVNQCLQSYHLLLMDLEPQSLLCYHVLLVLPWFQQGRLLRLVLSDRTHLRDPLSRVPR